DKFERENAEFFTRIRHAYLQRAIENPVRFRIIDADRPLEIVKKSVEDIILTI
ncbi:MAG: dTMP kinase, partial [Methylotenera sp.]|nr:dTMP kinase [Methylotenera sp.]